jgi:hypothetical protein
MGKKGVDGLAGDGSVETDIEALRMRMQKMEDIFQEQSKDLKAKVLSSQQSMKNEINEQMDEFFSQLMKVQTSTPPPQPHSVESLASNVAHAFDQTPTLGEASIPMPMFKLSASPPSQLNLPKQPSTTSYRNQTQPKPPFHHKPHLPPSLTEHFKPSQHLNNWTAHNLACLPHYAHLPLLSA